MLVQYLLVKREYCLRDKYGAGRLDAMVSWLWWFDEIHVIISGKLITELSKQKARYGMTGWRSLFMIM